LQVPHIHLRKQRAKKLSGFFASLSEVNVTTRKLRHHIDSVSENGKIIISFLAQNDRVFYINIRGLITVSGSAIVKGDHARVDINKPIGSFYAGGPIPSRSSGCRR